MAVSPGAAAAWPLDQPLAAARGEQGDLCIFCSLCPPYSELKLEVRVGRARARGARLDRRARPGSEPPSRLAGRPPAAPAAGSVPGTGLRGRGLRAAVPNGRRSTPGSPGPGGVEHWPRQRMRAPAAPCQSRCRATVTVTGRPPGHSGQAHWQCQCQVAAAAAAGERRSPSPWQPSPTLKGLLFIPRTARSPRTARGRRLSPAPTGP